MICLADQVEGAFAQVPPIYWVELEKYRGGFGDGNDVAEILEVPYSVKTFPLDESFLIGPTPTVAVRLLGVLIWHRARIIDASYSNGEAFNEPYQGYLACRFMRKWAPMWHQAFLNVSPPQIEITDAVCACEYEQFWSEAHREPRASGTLTDAEMFQDFADNWITGSWSLRQYLPDHLFVNSD